MSDRRRPGGRTHYPGIHPPTCDRWINAALGLDGRLWATVRGERAGRSHVKLLCVETGRTPMRVVHELDRLGHPQRPSLWISPVGDVHLVWNAYDGGRWRVLHGTLPRGQQAADVEVETIWEARRLCLPPSVAALGETLWAAWPARAGPAMRIMLARREAAGPWVAGPADSGAHNAFRPVLACVGKDLLVAWDHYANGRYQVVWRKVDASGRLGEPHVLAGEGNWLGPVAVAAGGGACYLAWQAVREVHDPTRGIVDHAVGVLCGVVRNGECSSLPAGADGPPPPAADLRPGLLAAENEGYVGYDGLRRRPQLAVAPDGEAWLCWEARRRGGRKRDGQLLGRRLDAPADPEPIVLHEGGVCYAVPSVLAGPAIPALFIHSDSSPGPVLAAAVLRPEQGAAEAMDPGAWRCWTPWRPAAPRHEAPTVQSPDGPLKLYWLDLHCHSVQSPDAEGEVDELLHYARDIAGLDGMAVVDNDHYPNKTLAEAEWQGQNELAEAFTEPGRFVVFPAYEYTYHDARLEPDFNHRWVLYCRPGGRLLRRIDTDSDTVEKLAAALEGEDVLLGAHHCTWRLTGRGCECVEVCSSWRVCIEETDFVHKRLAAGHRFGFVAASDSHRACPGMGGALTGVYAQELTPEAVLHALRRRRTIATQGRRVLIDFRAGDLFIGEEGTVRPPVALALRVVAPQPIEFVEIIRDGQSLRRFDRPGRQSNERFEDRDADAGTHYYFVRLKMVGEASFNAPGRGRDFYRPFVTDGPYASNLANAYGPFAWTSPIWVTVGE